MMKDYHVVNDVAGHLEIPSDGVRSEILYDEADAKATLFAFARSAHFFGSSKESVGKTTMSFPHLRQNTKKYFRPEARFWAGSPVCVFRHHPRRSGCSPAEPYPPG